MPRIGNKPPARPAKPSTPAKKEKTEKKSPAKKDTGWNPKPGKKPLE